MAALQMSVRSNRLTDVNGFTVYISIHELSELDMVSECCGVRLRGGVFRTLNSLLQPIKIFANIIFGHRDSFLRIFFFFLRKNENSVFLLKMRSKVIYMCFDGFCF